MAQHTGRLVVQNGFADTITVFQQKVEDVVLLEKVDVLVSEWMGTCLLFEFMIESILFARDGGSRRTGSSGPPWPRCTWCPAAPSRQGLPSKVLFWDNAYEFDLSALNTTHWKQTLFMMDDPVTVHTGDVVTGSVVLQRNPMWRRHMSVTLSWAVTSRQDPTSQRVGEKIFLIWR
ncbi:protein arginine N-methyltransferase 2-like [Dasypus novemcinctus]|uniref:protein arginine N-methyltransferase 2-like n=1 Tax=Dasypus novemcinctus TaxID=9361 RepID=UPI0026603CEC|nr:protein arginine N-methyltransferase 2-like [Dasypus novemcinctus]XP_058155233.1 protein arginine N-methyltransferase 2-like [Dasypus novemcinctus]XP_058155234.1 protein arginine N-methyltransferase 2-like [Dasypus novemcinctus]XP_058155235.1 protein arginine N-methyltransferase 2-like [Dasypus novemcinctus]XP_058155236.1 protein arginine N-methyltransferase 2-like [Dasypus novemcinctus]XP_058155237.1 protein arginine N-methyltransferase 2-like [Dasypus novemcinctus]XP_058155238.1 protein 